MAAFACAATNEPIEAEEAKIPRWTGNHRSSSTKRRKADASAPNPEIYGRSAFRFVSRAHAIASALRPQSVSRIYTRLRSVYRLYTDRASIHPEKTMPQFGTGTEGSKDRAVLLDFHIIANLALLPLIYASRLCIDDYGTSPVLSA